jgi:hypothetical protein
MIATWMFYTLVVSGLIAMGARGLDELGRSLRLSTRFLWLAALWATVSLAALAPLRASSGTDGASITMAELAAAGSTAAVETIGRPDALPGLLRRTVAGIREVVQWPLGVAAPLAGGDAGTWLGLGWLALSLGFLGVGTATVLRYRAARRMWPVLEVSGTRVRVAPTVGPAVLGLLRPEIVVPEWLMRSSTEEQRLVILHEREHLDARDPLVLATGCVAAVLLPWNPIAWWMLLRLRVAVEVDCDARVLRHGVRPRAYASMLIDLAGRGSGLSLGVPALAGSTSTLERRLYAMSTRFSRTGILRAGAFGLLGTAALLAACDTRMPTAAEVEQMDVAAVEAQAQHFRLLDPDTENVRYFIDGAEVSAAEARGFLADRIAQVEVVRATGETTARIGLRSRDNEVEVHGSDYTNGSHADVRVLRIPREGEDGTRARVLVRRQGEPGVTSVTDGEFAGLLVIDGIRVEPTELRNLRPDRIERMEVIKGQAATEMYDDPRAAQGVIRITTKAGTGLR